MLKYVFVISISNLLFKWVRVCKWRLYFGIFEM